MAAEPGRPTSKDVMRVLFENANQPLGVKTRELDCTGRGRTKGCRVLDYFQNVWLEIAGAAGGEGGGEKVNTFRYGSECHFEDPKDLPRALKYYASTGMHRKDLVAQFSKEHKKVGVFKCSVTWGVEIGDTGWADELRFFLDINHKLIPHTFAVHWTP